MRQRSAAELAGDAAAAAVLATINSINFSMPPEAVERQGSAADSRVRVSLKFEQLTIGDFMVGSGVLADDGADGGADATVRPPDPNRSWGWQPPRFGPTAVGQSSASGRLQSRSDLWAHTLEAGGRGGASGRRQTSQACQPRQKLKLKLKHDKSRHRDKRDCCICICCSAAGSREMLYVPSKASITRLDTAEVRTRHCLCLVLSLHS